MDNKIRYLNTDLDLRCTEDLTELAGEFESRGVYSLDVYPDDDGLWYARLETNVQHVEPESNIAAILTVVESLASPLRLVWNRCELREFNLGYDCGAEPWAFNQGLSAALLSRMAAVNASLRVTLYPDRAARV